MDNEPTYITTEASDFYHASRDCFRLRGGQNAAEPNGWQQHPLIPWTRESALRREKCKECVK